MVFILKSTPIVVLETILKLLSVSLVNKLVLPTLESPAKTIL